MAMRPTWMSPSMCALSPTISSFFETILPLKRPSMRMVSSNSSSPLNDEPWSRKPFNSPPFLLFMLSPCWPFAVGRWPFITPPPTANCQRSTSPAPHQILHHPNQLILAAELYANHAPPPLPIDGNFRSQSSLQLLLSVAREDVLRL